MFCLNVHLSVSYNTIINDAFVLVGNKVNFRKTMPALSMVVISKQAP